MWLSKQLTINKCFVSRAPMETTAINTLEITNLNQEDIDKIESLFVGILSIVILAYGLLY